MTDDPSKTKILPDGPAGELPVGANLSGGMYRVTGRIAAGGFGITYEARDNLERKVAIKECFPAGLALRAGDFTVSAASASTSEPFETARNLFLREARTLAALRHPNIVHVQTLFEENGTAYMAMDYIDGRDLQDVIDKNPELLTPAYVMELTRALLGALEYLHRDAPGKGKERLLHRDIKPANIRIDPLDTPVIIDFGAARQESKKQSRAAGTFRVVSDGYSPNEFYVAGTEQGPASDLYSLAATLHHCITGSAPVPADERAQKVSNGEDDPYEPIAGRFPGHDPRLLGLIDRALSRPLKDRPADAAAWFAAIPDGATRIVVPEDDAPANDDDTAATPVPVPPTGRASGGSFWKGAAVGGLALAILGGGAMALAPGLLPTGSANTDQLRAELDAANSTAETLRAEIAEATETSDMLEERLRAAEEQRGEAQERASALQDTITQLRTDLENAGGDTATLLEARANIARLEGQISRLEEQVAIGDSNTATELTAERDAAVADLNRALADLEQSELRIIRLESELRDAESEARTLSRQVRDAEAELSRLRAAGAAPFPPQPPTSTVAVCPDPLGQGTVVGLSGGEIYVRVASEAGRLPTTAGGPSPIATCSGLPTNVVGNTGVAPNYTLELSGMALFQRLQLSVAAECDATLLVNDASGAWHFNDDANGSRLPEIDLIGDDAVEGRVRVWVGSFDTNQCAATLNVVSFFE